MYVGIQLISTYLTWYSYLMRTGILKWPIIIYLKVIYLLNFIGSTDAFVISEFITRQDWNNM